jgi:vacuolar-type H+-ATPase subunit I/STV1
LENGTPLPVGPDPIPPEELDKLDALEAAATPGDWLRVVAGIRSGNKTLATAWYSTHDDRSEQDAALIVALRNAYPGLRAALREKEKQNEKLIALADADADRANAAENRVEVVAESLNECRSELGDVAEERDAAQSRVKELERALEKIAAAPWPLGDCVTIARAALAQEKKPLPADFGAVTGLAHDPYGDAAQEENDAD